jgi:phosphoenolpyruvate-protein kinase (PTS system EI component)
MHGGMGVAQDADGTEQPVSPSDDAYLQARYIDIEDLLHRTHLHLAQALENIPTPLRPSILIASDLYPSVMLQLDKKNIAGIALLQGSPHSHSAIIAREAGIPCCISKSAHWLKCAAVTSLPSTLPALNKLTTLPDGSVF